MYCAPALSTRQVQIQVDLVNLADGMTGWLIERTVSTDRDLNYGRRNSTRERPNFAAKFDQGVCLGWWMRDLCDERAAGRHHGQHYCQRKSHLVHPLGKRQRQIVPVISARSQAGTPLKLTARLGEGPY
jgi:hypothetical protein